MTPLIKPRSNKSEKKNKTQAQHFSSYSHVRKQFILKEMLSRETAEPGPGPSSVLNCSQNLQRDRAALTISPLVKSWIASGCNDVKKESITL